MTIPAVPGNRPALALATDPAEARSVERVIGFARAMLAMSAVAVIRLDPPQPSSFSSVTNGLLYGYAIFAIVLLAVLVRAHTFPQSLPIAAHVVDVAFPALLTLFSSGASSPMFTFLLYPLIAAAYRWGFREVMITAAVVDGLLAIEGLLAVEAITIVSAVPLVAAKAAPSVMESYRFQLNTFLLRSIYVAAMGAAVGYLAENEKRRRFEARAVSIVLVRGRSGGKLSDAVVAVLNATRDAFRAKQVLLVSRDHEAGRVFLWTSNVMTDAAGGQPEELPLSRYDDYLFDTPGAAWHAAERRVRGRGGFSTVAVDDAGQRIESPDLMLPQGFLAAHHCRRLVGVSQPLDEDWDARVLVIEPGVGVRREQNARFALNVVKDVAPALYNHYLIRRMRTRAQSLERRRIARELHDGVTQSLLGLEMEVVVLHRRAMNQAPQLADDLGRVHRIVRNEITAVRELMEGVRVVDIDSGDLMRHLGDVVDRFGRYTGITAKFVSSGPHVTLAPYLRREIARIVHEALVNVRKHSGADRVTVRVDVDEQTWKLSIEDTGRGFWFAGRRTQDELDEIRQGPATIAERVRSIGGVMAVESRPGFGAKVEVELDLPSAAEHLEDLRATR